MIKALMTATKPNEQERYEGVTYEGCLANAQIQWRFTPASLKKTTAGMIAGFPVVCCSANDDIDALCLKVMGNLGLKLIVMRNSNGKNVDMEAARQYGITVVSINGNSPQETRAVINSIIEWQENGKSSTGTLLL